MNKDTNTTIDESTAQALQLEPSFSSLELDKNTLIPDNPNYQTTTDLQEGKSLPALPSDETEKNPLIERIPLQRNDVHITELANTIAPLLAATKKYYFYINRFIKIHKPIVKTEQNLTSNFDEIDTFRFVTDIEEYIWPFTIKTVKDEEITVKSSFTSGEANLIMKSEVFKNKIPTIKLFSKYHFYYSRAGDLCLTHTGYNENIQVFVDNSAPLIFDIEPEIAQMKIRDLLKDFCFPKELRELYISRSVAYLLTPGIQNLIGYKRPQGFLVKAKIPGSGKGALLGMVPLIYDGTPAELLPALNENKEVKKLLFSLVRKGQNIANFDNQRAPLNFEALEQFATAEVVSDRVLGYSQSETHVNNLIIGISANNPQYSKDMERRLMSIDLEYIGGSILDRPIERNIDKFVLDNRSLLLSALFALIRNWNSLGRPLGKRIPSFSEWSSHISGILTANGFQDPFSEMNPSSELFHVEETEEQKNITELTKIWWNIHRTIEVRSEVLREMALQAKLFKWLDFNLEGTKSWFSKMIARRENTVFDNKIIRVIRRQKCTKFYLEERNEEL